MEEVAAMSLQDFCRRYGVGMTSAYAEMNSGRLRYRKLGRKTLIPVAAAEAWLNDLPEERQTLSKRMKHHPQKQASVGG